MQIIFIIRRFFALFFAAIFMLGSAGVSQTHDVKDPENCKMNFSVMSDVHMEGFATDFDRVRPAQLRFFNALRDIKNNKTTNDALVFLGDNTMGGQDFENMLFYGVIETIKPAEKIFTAMGNHDSGNGQNKYDSAAKTFWSYFNGFTGHNVTKPYYYEKLKNCYFIFMGSESDAVHTPDISDEQLTWLDEILTKAEADGLPAFVFNHHTPWHLADKSATLIDIITKHSDVFYISGHTHTTKLTASDFDEDSHYINLPKSTDLNTNGESDDAGLGLQVEIYESEIVMRARRFYNSEWSNYEFTYAVK